MTLWLPDREYLVQPGASQQVCYVPSGIDQPDLAFLATRPGEEAHEPSQASAVDVFYLSQV